MAERSLFVPGRVCLFGEHSDWAGGFRRFNADITPGATLVVGTNQVARCRFSNCCCNSGHHI
jgi:galactokinase